MQNQNSFIRNQQLYQNKLSRNIKIGTKEVSQFPQLGRSTVESVRDALIKAQKTTGKKEEPKKEESNKPKHNPAEEQYHKVQSLYNIRLNK